jgi:hypothetical protein
MSAEHHSATDGDLIQIIHENHALAAERSNNVIVVDDLMVSVDRLSAIRYDPIQTIHGHLHPGAETARGNQKDADMGLVRHTQERLLMCLE